jgi:hypothetical protein
LDFIFILYSSSIFAHLFDAQNANSSTLLPIGFIRFACGDVKMFGGEAPTPIMRQKGIGELVIAGKKKQRNLDLQVNPNL